MARIISLVNQKGGTAKTTTTVNLGAYLAAMGKYVLLIDLDPQANATLGLGLRLGADEKTIYDLFKDPRLSAEDVVRTTSQERLQIIPGSSAMSSVAVELISTPNWEYRLRSYLRVVKQCYHYILIDCPPALNALAINALTAADDMIIPIQTHCFSLQGMKELFGTVEGVREKLNPLLKQGKILPTIFDRRTKINREMLQSIRNYFKDQVLETVIHMNVRLIEAVLQGLPVIMYEEGSTGARDYLALARELIAQEAEQSRIGSGETPSSFVQV